MLKTFVESGIFQGAGWYRPDIGPIQLVAQVSGRLFTFTKNTGNTYDVAEITIPGDPNNSSTAQVWMWQSEKWLIITDGTQKLPIFYDGVTTRRSYGPSVLLAVANSFNPATPPAIGSTVQVTLTSPWTYGFNIPVLMNGAFYQATESSVGAYSAILTNITDTPGTTVPTGSSVVASGTKSAITRFNSTYQPVVTPPPALIGVNVESTAGILVGDVISAPWVSNTLNGNIDITVTAVNSVSRFFQGLALRPLNGNVNFVIPTGSQLNFNPPKGPDVIIGTTTADFTVPPVNGTVTISLNSPFTGTDGTVVWIGDKEYTIANPPTPSPSTTLNLINLTDTDTGAYGATENILSVPELPAGRMGVYVLGQNWMSLTDGIQFIASDIVGGASGTLANNKRDAVLKTTGQTFFGGNFSIPNSGSLINSMTATANLDTSLGQGALQVGTDSAMFSCLAPFDFQNPPDTRIPILTESLIGFGPLAQNSTIAANSDTLFRAFPGLASLVIARRDFGEWGNSPISREMTRVYSADDQSLLPYGSAGVFDNRFLDTCSPQTNPQGTIHQGIVALNFDLISSLRGKAPPVYDGLWTGLSTLQLVDIKSGSESRCFAFALVDGKIELHELAVTEGVSYQDDDTTPIGWSLETPVLFNRDTKPLEQLCRITNGELSLQEIKGTVDILVQYRPDFYDGWVDWKSVSITAPANTTSYRTRIGLGEPRDEACEANNNRPFRVGHFFQFRLLFTGQAKLMGFRVQATEQPLADFPPPASCDSGDQTLPIP